MVKFFLFETLVQKLAQLWDRLRNYGGNRAICDLSEV